MAYHAERRDIHRIEQVPGTQANQEHVIDYYKIPIGVHRRSYRQCRPLQNTEKHKTNTAPMNRIPHAEMERFITARERKASKAAAGEVDYGDGAVTGGRADRRGGEQGTPQQGRSSNRE